MIVAMVNGGALLDYRTRDGVTAMHRAVQASNFEAVKTLLGESGFLVVSTYHQETIWKNGLEGLDLEERRLVVSFGNKNESVWVTENIMCTKSQRNQHFTVAFYIMGFLF